MMDPKYVTLIMFVGTMTLMMTGLAVPWCMLLVSTIMLLLFWGPGAPAMLHFAAMETMGYWIVVAIPLFVFMGVVLEKGGIADDLYDTMQVWMGKLKGGLLAGTVGICTIMAAMAGISTVATVTMGLIALPSMLKRKYNKYISIGSIQAGGALGILIPPSATIILYGLLSRTSVGKLFAAGLLPGLLLSLLFITYILIRCKLQPQLAPTEDRRYPLKAKIISLKGIILPTILIVCVLLSIISGLASPTEAAAVGVLGAIACVSIKRRFYWKTFKKALYETMSITGMTGWVIISATIFARVYDGLGAPQMIQQLVQDLNLGPWTVMIIIQLSFFFFGMFLDDATILFITMPVYVPLVKSMGFDPVWFGVLFVINMQMAYITPPYGENLFYMKAVAPPEISIKDIYKSALPFVALQAIGLIVVMLWPELALWLPDLLFK